MKAFLLAVILTSFLSVPRVDAQHKISATQNGPTYYFGLKADREIDTKQAIKGVAPQFQGCMSEFVNQSNFTKARSKRELTRFTRKPLIFSCSGAPQTAVVTFITPAGFIFVNTAPPEAEAMKNENFDALVRDFLDRLREKDEEMEAIAAINFTQT